MRNLVGSEGGEHVDLCKAGRFGPPVGKIYDFSLPAPSMAACGSSTKLVSPSESQ
jgi:hypothetical protein